MGSSRKEVQAVIDEVLAQGWVLDDRGDKVLLYSPDGRTIVTLHWTPSDRRWRENAYRDLRRGGFVKVAKSKGKEGK